MAEDEHESETIDVHDMSGLHLKDTTRQLHVKDQMELDLKMTSEQMTAEKEKSRDLHCCLHNLLPLILLPGE